ncbi:MAG: glycosyltransferase [Phycisphaerales bacterium]|nr:glycosyltransferase [Phycisphaerales bacterium]
MDNRPQSHHVRCVAALVATRDRIDLLRQRSIPSILAQSRLPDRLVIVVDQSKEELSDSALKAIADTLQADCGGRLPVTVLRNRRTQQRASGAWNTGIDQLHRDGLIMRQPDLWFVAILDDDDAWEPEHIDACLEEAVAADLNMVVSGLIRHEVLDEAGRRQTIPQTLEPRQQFISGQHIQGSNLFVRLDVLLQVGGFDEHLPSCTDRDLCIRLSALPLLRFGCTSRHTVHHFADARKDRLSAPSSSAKLDGLTRFWLKHADRFDEAARTEAAERALRLFGWRLPTIVCELGHLPPLVRDGRQLSLIAGFVTDAKPPSHVDGLLEDLLALASQPDIDRLLVVIVENGPTSSDGTRPLHDLVSAYRERGLAVELVSIEQQRADWEQGKLIDTPDPTRQRLRIAVTRTVLNTYVARIAANQPGAAAWILDDDKRLTVRVATGGQQFYRPTPDVSAILALRDAGVDMVIGPDTDAAPLPFTATLRVQLIDLERQLALLAASSPSAAWEDRSGANAVIRDAMPDSYYDLSKHTEHLETPFSLKPSGEEATLADALQSVASRVDRLLAGEAIFRPLAVNVGSFAVDAAIDSVQRGGSTIFFRPEHLLEYPQNMARFGDRFVRRSDMLVTQLMRDQMGLKIVMHASAGVRHDRTFTKRSQLDDVTLWEDVLGYALYRAANELMQARSPERRREPLLAWTADELKSGTRRVRKYINERLAAFTLNAWRILGLADSIRHAARRMMDGSSEWSVGRAREQLVRIAKEMDRIYSQFKPTAVAMFAEKIRKSVSDADIRNTFGSMDGLISEYRSTRSTPGATDAAVAAARERRARALLKRAFGAAHLRLLGAGGEGIVFTDEVRVFKVLDLLKRRPNHDTLETLKTLSNRLDQPKHLYSLSRVEVRDETLLVVYPFEASEPYAGGCGAEMLGLLRECKSNGVVFRNIHPKNLRVSATGLKLIDYGSDIRPYSEDGYRSMAERAWLTWRWPHRADLDELMRRALVDKSMPELDGFERFWRALNDERPSATRIVSGIVDPIVLESGAKSVLDYGCGKKARSARRLAEAGLRSVGYDPGAEMLAKWQTLGSLPPGLLLTTERDAALETGPFDAVVSSLVLCELGEGPEYEQLLRDLRAAVRPGGLVVVSFCNPIGTFGGPTNLHRRRDVPAGANYESSFWYVENAETGKGRREFHRPLAQIERDLLRHGLRVERRVASETVDTDRFEPASDFLTLICRPVETPTSSPRVSLLIKTCAMESATIERQVTHLVSQLEGPRMFCERVLVIDSLREGFVRQHAVADMDALICAAERLRAIGVVDRVLCAPSAGDDPRRVMRDWFAIDCEHTHSAAGAPLVAPLWAMEKCLGEYILQVDSDVLIHRVSHTYDYLGDMISAIEEMPEAITASLSVPQITEESFTPAHGGVPWRVEVRGSLFHRDRLLSARPFSNQLAEGWPVLSWHRSLDLAAKEGRIDSLRCASTQLAFVHPANDLKRAVADWMLLMDLVEKYPVPAGQIGKVDLVGGPLLWAPTNRAEPFIFVVTGRNVPAGRIARCLESMTLQRRGDWGAVIVDDGSCALSQESLRMAIAPWKDRITLIQPRERRGQLANMTLAIRHVCTNPESVIVTLDLDDALIGSSVLDRIEHEYSSGADVTIGSMLRTDKHVEYPVVLDAPRRARGGNVWQHLRTFRKRLFDAIPDHDLRVGDKYVDIAVDWSFMLPIVEMAHRPVWIREALYLYEPSGLGKGLDRSARETQIGAIVAKPPRRPRAVGDATAALLPMHVSESVWGDTGGILFVRHGERPSFAGLNAEQKDAVHLTENGHSEASSLGQRLGQGIRMVSSPVLRAVQTAAAIATAVGIPSSEASTLDSLVKFRIADTQTYGIVKSRLGWGGLMSAWMDGSLPDGVLIPCHVVALNAIRDVLAVAGDSCQPRIVAVTHDFVIMALLASLRGVRTTAVPYLGGVFVNRDDARSLGAMECNK